MPYMLDRGAGTSFPGTELLRISGEREGHQRWALDVVPSAHLTSQVLGSCLRSGGGEVLYACWRVLETKPD